MEWKRFSPREALVYEAVERLVARLVPIRSRKMGRTYGKGMRGEFRGPVVVAVQMLLFEREGESANYTGV
jgi:hypothetical protein